MRRAAWLLPVSGAGAVLWAALAPLVHVTEVHGPRLSTPFHAVSRLYRADSLVRQVVTRDVFRQARRPAVTAYDPQRAAAPVETNQLPKPVLALVGLVAGAEPTAVIEGLPGIEGARVVRVGDQVSGVRVVRIELDRIRLVGLDTVWVLRVREPWN